MSATAKLFMHGPQPGGATAEGIPLEGSEVRVSKVGDKVDP